MPTMTKDIRSETMAQNGLHGTSSPIAQPRPTLATTSGTATSGQDEFFTSSVAVQHKRNAQESSHSMQQQHQQQHHQQFKTSQSYAYNSASSSAYQEYDEDPQFRKVLWPANYNIYQPEMAAADPLNVHTPQINEHIDKPLSWIQSVANSHERVESKEREYEMDIQKRTWDVHLANNRLSRSKSRSILDRAKSYERSTMNANEVSMSLPGSRRGSFSRRIPSPAMNGRIGQNQNDNFWQTAVDGADSRPQSRTDHDSRKWSSVGKLNTSDWEEKIRNASKSSHQLQGPRRIQYDKNLPYSVGGGSVSDQHQFQQKSSTSKTNSSSLNQLAQSCSKEEIIEQWMRQSTTNPAPKIRSTNNEDEKPTGSKQSDDELRRFAYDMAQSMVSSMERTHNEKMGNGNAIPNQNGQRGQPNQSEIRRGSNESSSSMRSYHTATSTNTIQQQQQQHQQQHHHQNFEQTQSKDHAETGMFRAVPAQANPDVQEGNWENWREIAEQRRQEERQRAAQKAHQRKGTQMQEQQGSPATKNRQHQQTTSYDQYQSSSSQQMKQKHYFQEQQSMKERQIQAIYQQNQGQGPQQRIMEPQQQQQQTNVKMKVVSSNAGGNATYQDQRSLKEKKLALQQQRDHERQMMITERKRQEEHRFHEQRTQQQMEEVKLEEEQRIQQQKLLEERRFQEEQLIQKQKIQEQKRIQEEQRIQQQKIQEQKRIQEEQRFHQQKVQEEKMIQQQKIENEKKIQEQRRIQEQAYFEEQQRLEETRFREQKKRFEEQMRMEEQRKQTEQDMVIRQQRERFEAERKKYEYSLANNHQFSRQEEKHLSKQFEQQSFQAAEPKTRRAPKVKLQKAQSFNQEDMESLKTDHFANIKTGQVNEKRHFWMRSSSNERLNEQRFQSPGPRRRWIGEKDWIRQQALKNLDNSSPQGSSFSHATDFGNVKHVAKDWTNIVKSKSSTAILQDNYESRSRPGSSLSKPVPSWLREDQASDSTLHLTRDIHTNQVKETVEAWPSKSRESSQQPHSGRSTPAPTRHIGESFADNRIAKDGKVELRYESAPTKASKVQPGNAPEPSLKLVNVAVMRVKHEDQDKIKFSHTAQEQMKSFTSSETKATISNPSSNTFQEQKHSSDFTPLRKLGTKETIPEPIRHTQTIQEPNNKIQPVIPFGTTSSKSTQNYNSQEHFQHMTAKQHTAKAEKFSLNTPDFVHKEQIDGTKSGGYRFEAPRSSNIPTSNSQENNEQRQLPTRPNEEQRDEHILANSFKSSVSKSSKTDAQQTATQNQWTTKTSVSKPQEPRESFFEPSGPTQPMQKPLRQSLEPTPTMNKTTSNFSTASFMQKNNQMKKQPMQDSKVHSDGQMFAKPEVRPQETAHSMTIIEDKMQAADNSSSHSYDKSDVNKNAAKPTFGRTPPKIPFSKGRAGEDGTQGKPPVPSPRIPSPDKRPPPTMPKPKMQPVVPLNVANKNLEPQNGLPMPVSQSWFDASAEASEVSSTSSFGHFEQIAPPQGTNKTPIPVLAGWFDEEQRKGKPQSNESLKRKPQTQRGAQAPIPPPPPPPQMNKKEKRVDFVEPPPFSPPPESDISSLNIEEMSEGGTDIEEIPIRGNVKGNIALFQEGSTGNRPKQGGHEDWKDSMKGCVSQSRQAYVQQTSNLDKDDSERLERQKELEEISKARAQTNWDNTSPHEGSESLKDSRTRELQAIAELRSKRAADAWEAERSSEKVLEATRDQRAKELQEIASMRSQNNWDEVNAEVRAKADRSQVIQEQRQIDHGPTEPSPQPLPKNPNDLDIDEMISSFQDVAASWQQRESEPQAPANQTQRAEVPSRRIGNLFKRPPAQTGESPNIPSPPPRESSKDYMMDVHQQNKQI